MPIMTYQELVQRVRSALGPTTFADYLARFAETPYPQPCNLASELACQVSSKLAADRDAILMGCLERLGVSTAKDDLPKLRGHLLVCNYGGELTYMYDEQKLVTFGPSEHDFKGHTGFANRTLNWRQPYKVFV
jgi:hypothetical protein